MNVRVDRACGEALDPLDEEFLLTSVLHGDPTQLQDLWVDPGVKNWRGPYWLAANADLDPWGNPWIYTPTPSGLTITSYGADGAPGGSDQNADVVVSRP